MTSGLAIKAAQCRINLRHTVGDHKIMRRIIKSPNDTDILKDLDGPLIYLNGPIQGTSDWQSTAIRTLNEFAPNLHVASPRSTRFTGSFEEQLTWETAFIQRAAKSGCIVFWLARETNHRCHRAYAQQARFELGEWAVLSRAGLARIVVGIESGFTGGPFLHRRLTLAYPNIPICSTLRQTCAAAAELSYSVPTTLAYPFLTPRAPALRDLVPKLSSIKDNE